MTHCRSWWLAIIVMAVAAPAAGQTNEETFQQFQWNFATPGARATAMGRAFIGLADDATATVTNPAGLTSLTRRQVYLEFKRNNLRTERLSAVDSFFTRETEEFSTATSSLPFFTVGVPIGSVAVAFTRHEFLNYDEDFELDPRAVPSGGFAFPVDASARFKGVSYVGSAAATLGERLDVGVSVSFNKLDARSRLTRFAVTGSGLALNRSSVLANESEIDDDDSAVAWTIGVRGRPTEMVTVGFVYAKAPVFKIDEVFTANPGYPFSNQTMTLLTAPEITIHVPDRIGGGIAVRPTSRLLFSFDAVRLKYSNLTEEVTPILDRLVVTGDEFEADDVTELHFGGEWLALPGDTRVFVRAGLFTDPFHGVRYKGGLTGFPDAFYEAVYNLIPEKDRTVGTLGLGVAHGTSLQFDVAYAWKQDFVASVAVRF